MLTSMDLPQTHVRREMVQNMQGITVNRVALQATVPPFDIHKAVRQYTDAEL